MRTLKATMMKTNKSGAGRTVAMWALLVAVLLASLSASADKKKKNSDDQAAKPKVIDYSNIVWPNPPAIARVKYQAFYAAQKISQIDQPSTKKQKWMDRLAGTQPAAESGKVLFQLAEPYGMAVDSKNNLYVADQKVGAVFVFNTETRDVDLIKNKVHAHFGRIIGLAIDDNDRLFVSDPALRHVLVFDATHKAEDVITEGMSEPGGMAIDRENRLLYVSDVALDQVLVYDADSLKLLRRIGTGGKNHFLTTPGDFGAPQCVAVDKDGNVYVTDTLNNRVEIFDADGNFISQFGKAGDGPGFFSRPKGIAVDGDGHIWVADSMQDRLQVFNRDGQLLTYIGQAHGELPGQFKALVGVAIDKNNKVFTTEQEPGRLQVFHYINDAEAAQEKQKHEDEMEKAAEQRRKAAAQAPSDKPGE